MAYAGIFIVPAFSFLSVENAYPLPSLLFDINMRITGPDKRQSKDYFCDVFSDLLLRELNENEISHIVNIRRDIA